MSHSPSCPARDSRVPFSRVPAGQRHRLSSLEKETGTGTPCEGSFPCLRSSPIMERTCGGCQEACVTGTTPPWIPAQAGIHGLDHHQCTIPNQRTPLLCHSERSEESKALLPDHSPLTTLHLQYNTHQGSTQQVRPSKPKFPPSFRRRPESRAAHPIRGPTETVLAPFLSLP